MAKRIILIICVTVSILAITGCGNYEPWDEFDSGNVPESVKSDFYRRYSDDVIVKDALTYHYKNYNNTSRIEFIDVDGLPCVAIYIEEEWTHTWKEYSKDNFLFLSQLPKKVARGYIRAGIDDEDYTGDNSYVIEVSRRGFDQKYYEFHCAAPYVNGNLQYIAQNCHVLIGEDGEVIDVLHTKPNPSTWFHDMDKAVTSVTEKYPGAIVIGAVNVGGRNVIYIKDEGILKRVLLNDDRWNETVTKLGKWFKLPDNVMDEYTKYKSGHPDFEYSEVYKIERKDGVYYGLEMMVLKGNQISLTVYIKA